MSPSCPSISDPIQASPNPHRLAINPLPNRMPPRTLSTGVIRVGVTKEIVPLLREFGADPDEVIRGAGLEPALFGDENNLIPYAALGGLLARCVAHTRCPHFGLLVGQRGFLSAIGPVGGLMRHLPTVGDAVSALVAHLHLHDRGAAPTLTVADGQALLGYVIYQPGVESPEQISDGALAVGMNIMRALCGPDWGPDEVLLPRDPPADQRPYRGFFHAPVRFNQETATLVFPARWLAHRIAGADPIFRQVFEAHVQQLEAGMDDGWKENLRRMLRTEILANRCSATAVAGRLAVHPRTLSRRLHADGAGYRNLVGETRFEVARQLLAQNGIPLSQVAAALGYSEASAFTRAFRRWSGQTPTAWRASQMPASNQGKSGASRNGNGTTGARLSTQVNETS